MRTLVVAPHADDELLGCGGTLLRRRQEGCIVGWLLVTAMNPGHAWDAGKIEQRRNEIQQVRHGLGVLREHLYELGLQTTRLDQMPEGDLIQRMSEVFAKFQPEEVFVPHFNDVHSDHRIVFDAVAACTKWFRYPSVKRVLAYETLSETEFGLAPALTFRPNFFVNIDGHLEEKLRVIQIYGSELGLHPFPRSLDAIKALATLRGAAAGYKAAEAFDLLRERT